MPTPVALLCHHLCSHSVKRSHEKCMNLAGGSHHSCMRKWLSTHGLTLLVTRKDLSGPAKTARLLPRTHLICFLKRLIGNPFWVSADRDINNTRSLWFKTCGMEILRFRWSLWNKTSPSVMRVLSLRVSIAAVFGFILHACCFCLLCSQWVGLPPNTHTLTLRQWCQRGPLHSTPTA